MQEQELKLQKLVSQSVWVDLNFQSFRITKEPLKSGSWYFDGLDQLYVLNVNSCSFAAVGFEFV